MQLIDSREAAVEAQGAFLGELVLLHLAAGSVRQIVMGDLPPLVSRDCVRRQQWQLFCGREERSYMLVRQLGGAQDVCAITAFGSPWPIHPSVSMPGSSSHIRGSGPIRCSSFSSVWRRSPSNASDASGEPQSVEQPWKDYFADPAQWWDNRADKRDPRSPDFRHKVTRKALWVYGWSTPPWVKARLNLAGCVLRVWIMAALEKKRNTWQQVECALVWIMAAKTLKTQHQETGYPRVTRENEAWWRQLQESRGILSRVAAVVYPWKLQEARWKQSVL